jgi:hypothetical protein
MPPSQSPYDYEEGLQRIATRLSHMRSSGWTPTPEHRRLTALISEINQLADRLMGLEWSGLRDEFEADETNPFVSFGEVRTRENPNNGRFEGLIRSLRELGIVARSQLELLPDARLQSEVPHAARLFVHLRHRCGKPLPTAYEQGEAVIEFTQMCESAGVFLSPVRLRSILSQAIKEFDRHIFHNDLDEILVVRE